MARQAAGGVFLGRRAAALCQAQLPVSGKCREERAGPRSGLRWRARSVLQEGAQLQDEAAWLALASLPPPWHREPLTGEGLSPSCAPSNALLPRSTQGLARREDLAGHFKLPATLQELRGRDPYCPLENPGNGFLPRRLARV